MNLLTDITDDYKFENKSTLFFTHFKIKVFISFIFSNYLK